MPPRLARIILPLLILIVGAVTYRLTTWSAPPPPVVFGQKAPWKITPQESWRDMVTDAQLQAILERMKPLGGPPATNKMVHALRMWGVEADFNDPNIPTGAQIRDYFLDDRQFRKMAGENEPPLFVIREDGTVVVRSLELGKTCHCSTASHHLDDLLATLTKAEIPRDAPLITRNGTTTFGALVDTAMHRSRLGQMENEWTMIAYARDVFPLPSWKNLYGEQVRAEDMIRELIDRPLKNGTCGGTHRLEALTLLLRVDDQTHTLAPELRQDMIDHLKKVSQILVESQSEEGYWTRTWYEGKDSLGDEPGEIYDRLLITGHHLEWLALAPPEVLPPRETILRAGHWVAKGMLEVDDATLHTKYGPLSHAARALCLWRNMEPFEAWKKLNKQPKKTEE